MSGFRLPTLLCVSLTALSLNAAQADSPDTSNWLCALCPFETGTDYSIETGLTQISESAPRYASDSGYDRRGAYLDIAGRVNARGQDAVLEVTAANLALDTRTVDARYRRHDGGSLRYLHREIPAYYFFDARLLLQPDSTGVVSPPPDWQPAATTAGFDQTLANDRTGAIRLKWQSDALTLALTAGAGWQATIGFERQAREGHRRMGLANFSQATMVATRIDDVLDRLRLSAGYDGQRGGVRMTTALEHYDNRRERLDWRSPFIVPPGAELSAMAMAPDYYRSSFSVTGYRRFSSATQLTLALSRNHVSQDEPLLDYSTNPAFRLMLPRARSDLAIESKTLDLTLTQRPIEALRLKLRYRERRRDNRAEIDSWTPVIVDSFASGDVIENRRFGWTRRHLSADSHWRPSRSLVLQAGLDALRRDRDAAVVGRQSEQRSWLRLRWRPLPSFRTSISASASERDRSQLDAVARQATGINPRTEQFHLAYRYRTQAEFQVEIDPATGPLSFSATAGFVDDDYSKTVIGLLEQRSHRWGVMMRREFATRADVHLELYDQRRRSRQTGSEQFAAPDWLHTGDDRFRGVRLGINWAESSSPLSLTSSVALTRARTLLRTQVDAGLQGEPFPALRADTLQLSLHARYRRSQTLSAYLAVFYDELASADWALDSVDYLSLPALADLGLMANDHGVLRVSIGVQRRFDGE